jgi:hypothetical protein
LAAGLQFVLAHALYLKAIHGGKNKNDRIDSEKLALLLAANLIPPGLRLSRRQTPRPRPPAPTVWSKCSCGLPVVEPQQPSQALTCADLT